MSLYSTILWHAARARALERDRSRCTVSRLLGGRCAGPLHVHHLVRPQDGGERYALDNLGTACAAHHAQWEALRRQISRRRESRRCPHRHASREARELCEARLTRLA